MKLSNFRKTLDVVGMAASDEADGGASASEEGKKETGRETVGNIGDMNSFNLKNKLAFTWMECFLATWARKNIYYEWMFL